MPTERLSMRKIRDVLRLKFESGLSERVIGRTMSLSNGSVNSCLQRARMAGLGWPLPDGLDDAALERLLFPPAAAPDAAGARARPEWAALDKEMRRKGVTLADAILDRLVHNAHGLPMTGESMRKLAARKRVLDDASKA